MRAHPVPSITIKNLPANLHRRLRERAESSGRSLNREIIACLLEAAGAERVDGRALLAEVRPLRRLVRGQVSDAEVSAAKRAGRR
jgi:plasmid stability protein